MTDVLRASEALEQSLNETGVQLGDAQAALLEVGARSEAAVTDALDSANQALLAAWDESSRQLASAKSAILGEASAQALAALSRDTACHLGDAVAASQELAVLQLATDHERQILAALSAQREGLHADIAKAQSTLVGLRCEIEPCRVRLDDPKAEQARQREDAVTAAVRSVEHVLRDKFAIMDHGLVAGLGDTRQRLGTMEQAANSACSTLDSVEVAASLAAEQTMKTVASWKSSTKSSCKAVKDATLRAARGLSDASSVTQGVSTSLAAVEATQQEVALSWAAFRHSGLQAAAAWRASGAIAAQCLEKECGHAAATKVAFQDLLGEVLHRHLAGH